MRFFRQGRGRSSGGSGRGLGGGNKPGAGPDGNCICPKCGHRVPHQRGMPCHQISCPKCGTSMLRE